MSELKEVDDKVLVAQAKAGDRKALEELYERYINKIYGKCLSITKNTEQAKDLAHDIFIKIFMRLHSYGGVSNFSSWVYAVTYNHCMTALSSSKRRRELEEDSIYPQEIHQDPIQLEEDLQNIRIHQLKQAIPMLDIEERSILLMRYQDGLSIKEIVQILRISESAVKMRLKRSREKLATYIKRIANER